MPESFGVNAAPFEPDESLHRRLTILTAARLAIVTALLGATAWVSVKPDESLGGPLSALLYGLIGFVYSASLAYLWWLRRRRRLQSLAIAQVVGDLALATFLVYLTGGADSLFTLLYPLAVVNASILLSRGGAVGSAVGGALMFGGLVVALDAGTIEPAAPYLAQRELTTLRLAFIVVANGSAFLLTAALASYLTEQLRRTGERLSAREDDLAALSELHRSIVRSMSTGILTVDGDGRVTFVNPAAERITGFGLRRVKGEPLGQWLPVLAAAIGNSIENGTFRGEIDEHDAGGALRRLGFVVNPLSRGQDAAKPGNRREPRLAIVLEDLTALQSMREAVERSDRLAAIGRLAAGLAHELRNPLASMSGAVELLARGDRLNDAERRLMAIVLREAERLNALVTDFLSFARPTPVVPQPVDLAAIADETLGMFRHGPHGGRLELRRTGETSLRCFVDPSQLRQVLWNLVKNAAESVEGPGSVCVDVGWTPQGQVRLNVSDSGPGIRPDDMAHLFEPFFTTKAQGTGLGLANVHQIVVAHHGRVEVESRPGKGATFSVILPVGDHVDAPRSPLARAS